MIGISCSAPFQQAPPISHLRLGFHFLPASASSVPVGKMREVLMSEIKTIRIVAAATSLFWGIPRMWIMALRRTPIGGSKEIRFRVTGWVRVKSPTSGTFLHNPLLLKVRPCFLFLELDLNYNSTVHYLYPHPLSGFWCPGVTVLACT